LNDMQELLQILTVISVGALKMMVAAGFGAGFGFTFFKTFLFTSIGGCLGVLVFYRLSDWLMERSRLQWLRKRAEALLLGGRPLKPVFTKRNRRIVRLKHVSGYLGVAALTPLVLTIPLGSILAARFFHHDRRTVPALLLSVVLQALGVSAVLTGVVGQFAGI
jgi:hypothetical protein